MSTWEAILLGILQGLTEFLPVSSSGHLELAGALFGIEGESNLGLVMALHGGTVVSTIVVFWRQIGRLMRGVCAFRWNDESIYAAMLAISMVPVIFVGLFFKEQIEGLFTGDLMVVGCGLLLTAATLTISHFYRPKDRPLTPSRAFMIGLAQAAAALPGLSRSGATISTGLMLGVGREQVARFSFLMVLVPVIGVNVMGLLEGDFGTQSLPWATLAAGFVAAFVSGALACRWMIRLVSQGRLIGFAAYCVVVGVVCLIEN